MTAVPPRPVVRPAGLPVRRNRVRRASAVLTPVRAAAAFVMLITALATYGVGASSAFVYRQLDFDAGAAAHTTRDVVLQTLGLDRASPHLFLLPGPPRELAPIVDDSVLPLLRRIVPPREHVEMRVLRLNGVGESHVEERVGEPLLALGLELGYCARPSEVDVRLIGTSEQVERGDAIVRAAFPSELISDDGRSLEEVIVERLTTRGQTLATVESCTGGALAHRITNVPGASRVFLAGYVTYANDAKARDAGVDPALLAAHGAASEPVARAMAEGARLRTGASFSLSTTGIAGPDGGTAEKPVGTVFIGLAVKDAPTVVAKHFFPRDRETFKRFAVQTALQMLLRTAS